MAGDRKSTKTEPASHKLIWAIATRNVDEATGLIAAIHPGHLLESDTSGKTAIHEAIDKGFPEIIGALITKNPNVLNQRNSKKMSPLAFAMQKYVKTPSDFNLSIVNQIYFALNPYQRIQQLEEELDENIVHVPFSFGPYNYRSALWRQALEMCMERNGDGVIESINMHWVDFINKAMDTGLSILGWRVTPNLIDEYTRSKYDSTAGDLLARAFSTRTAGLAQRTLTQAAVNQTLTQSVEFMSQAKMELPLLIKSHYLPSGLGEAIICVHKGGLEEDLYFYRNKKGETVQLDPQKMSPSQQEKFPALKEEFSKKGFTSGQKADFRQASLIEEIRPLQRPEQRPSLSVADLPPPPPRLRTLRTIHSSGRAPTMFKQAASAQPAAKSADLIPPYQCCLHIVHSDFSLLRIAWHYVSEFRLD